MKRIALFILLIFATVQVVPGLKACISDHPVSVVFAMDEEKHGEKSPVEFQKDKKTGSTYHQLADLLSYQLNTAFHVAEKILPAPCLEQPTPPPNC